MSKPLSPILIAGPTASGKSALALRLAQETGGAIVNADSMQVYAELRVLTARPTPADEALAPHALYGHVPARDAYSAGRFVTDAAAAIANAQSTGRRPIVVGGTGLYFMALLEGLSPIPPIADDVRAHWRGQAERLGAKDLHALLASRDAGMASRLNPADTQRIVRALEVLDQTGRSLADWQQQKGTPVLRADETVRLVISADRAWLTDRADARVEAMVKDGAVAEAAGLAALDLDPALPAMRAIGVAPMIAAARGQMSIAAAVERAKAETRQYVKRQQTWLQRNMITWREVKPQQMESLSP